MSRILGGKSDEERRKEQMKDQRDQQLHRQAQGMATDPQTQQQREFVEQLVKQDVDDQTARLLQNMLAQDLPLSNISDAEMTEIKWLTRVLKLKIFAMHPPQESVFQGDFRKFVADDEYQGLRALSDKRRSDIDQLVRVIVQGRVARGRDGFQQEQIGKSMHVSKVDDSEETSDGGLFS